MEWLRLFLFLSTTMTTNADNPSPQPPSSPQPSFELESVEPLVLLSGTSYGGCTAGDAPDVEEPIAPEAAASTAENETSNTTPDPLKPDSTQSSSPSYDKSIDDPIQELEADFGKDLTQSKSQAFSDKLDVSLDKDISTGQPADAEPPVEPVEHEYDFPETEPPEPETETPSAAEPLHSDAADSSDADDRIVAGPGNDRVLAGDGNDRVDGGPGNDDLRGGAGDDQLRGGKGDDLLVGSAGDDVIDGGEGNDTAVFESVKDVEVSEDGSAKVRSEDGTDLVTNVETLRIDGEDISLSEVQRNTDYQRDEIAKTQVQPEEKTKNSEKEENSAWAAETEDVAEGVRLPLNEETEEPAPKKDEITEPSQLAEHTHSNPGDLVTEGSQEEEKIPAPDAHIAPENTLDLSDVPVDESMNQINVVGGVAQAGASIIYFENVMNFVGTQGDDNFIIRGAKDGDVFNIDGGKGNNRIDLSNIEFNEIAMDEGNIEVDDGDKCFVIHHRNVQDIKLAGNTVVGASSMEGPRGY